MRIQIIFQILIFSPVLLSAQTIKEDLYKLDTVQSFSSTQSQYEFNLTGLSQGLFLGQLQSDSLNDITVKIVNNSGQAVVISYTDWGCAVKWTCLNNSTDTVQNGEAIYFCSNWIRRLGIINCPIILPYSFVNGEKLKCQIRIWGTIIKTTSNTLCTTTQEKDYKTELPKTNQTQNTDEKFSTPTLPDANCLYCIQWFGKGTIHYYDSEKLKYEFRIDNNKWHNFSRSKGINDIFCWDTITRDHYEKTFIFNFKNDSQYPLFILDFSAYSQNFAITNIGKNIILPDSSALFSFQADSSQHGNFHGNVSISYQRNEKMENYDLGLCGYQPSNSCIPKYTKNNNKADSATLFLIDQNLKTQGYLTMKIVQNGRVFYPKFNNIHNEFFCNIPLKYTDSTWYEIRNESNQAITKGYIPKDSSKKNLYIEVNNSRKTLHTYLGGPQNYEFLDSVYFMKWNMAFKSEEVTEYLYSKGIDINYACLPYFKPRKTVLLNELQKEIFSSEYKIVILPVIRYSLPDANNWGGGCEYYTNEFQIGFSKNVTREFIENTFRNQGLFNFVYIGEYKGLKMFSFYFDTIIDMNFVKILDNLWDIPEVYYIEHIIYNIAGLD